MASDNPSKSAHEHGSNAPERDVAEELERQRDKGGETGGMGREGTPRETPTQGGWQRPRRVPRHEELSDDKPS